MTCFRLLLAQISAEDFFKPKITLILHGLNFKCALRHRHTLEEGCQGAKRINGTDWLAQEKISVEMR